jgi:hypothetical protein
MRELVYISDMGIHGPAHVVNYFYFIGDMAYHIVNSIPASEIDSYQPIFSAMMDSFRITRMPDAAFPQPAQPAQPGLPSEPPEPPVMPEPPVIPEPPVMPEPPAMPEPPELPQPVLTATEILADVIFNTNNVCWLVIYWENGTTTVFERDEYTLDWIMYSRDGSVRQVEPSFSLRGSTFLIGFPTTTRVYNLFNDGTGFFGDEALVWIFDY